MVKENLGYISYWTIPIAMGSSACIMYQRFVYQLVMNMFFISVFEDNVSPQSTTIRSNMDVLEQYKYPYDPLCNVDHFTKYVERDMKVVQVQCWSLWRFSIPYLNDPWKCWSHIGTGQLYPTCDLTSSISD